MNRILLFRILALSGAVFLACGGCGGPDAPKIRVDESWARAMPLLEEGGGGMTNSAVYLVVQNNGDAADWLRSAETSVASRVEVHESKMVDDVMRMRRIDGLEVPPRGTVELRPGGIHLMLLGLTRPLVEGEEFDLTLNFEGSGDLTVTVPIRS